MATDVGPTSAAVRADPFIGVLEIDPTGHRLQYLRHLVEAAGPGSSVVLTSGDAVGSEEFATHAAPVAGAEVVLLPAGSRRVVLDAALSAAVAAGVHRLVIPEGDLYLWPMARALARRPRLPLKISLLLMRTTVVGGPEPLRPATIVKPVLVQALRLFRQVRVSFLTDALGVVSHRRGYFGVRPVQDPVDRRVLDGPAAGVGDRPAWFPPADPATTLVGMFGVISGRKNLPVLVAALAFAPDVVVVVGGRLEDDVREFVGTGPVRALVAAGRLVVIDRMLGEAEFSAALAHVDVVAVLYDNDAPSGILAEACLRGTPVLAPASGWLGLVTRRAGVGVTTELDARSVAAAIGRVAADRDALSRAALDQRSLMNVSSFTDELLGRAR